MDVVSHKDVEDRIIVNSDIQKFANVLTDVTIENGVIGVDTYTLQES